MTYRKSFLRTAVYDYQNPSKGDELVIPLHQQIAESHTSPYASTLMIIWKPNKRVQTTSSDIHSRK